MTTGAEPIRLSGWALVLGASSGFGAATSLALARAGLHIFGVHLDRKSTLPNAERLAADIKALGREAHFYNVNAADEEKRAEVASEMERILRERDELGQVRVMLHSLAFGTLKLFIADPMKEAVTKAQMDMTLDVMAHSLIYWAQELVSRGLMGRGGRIYAMTSAGGARVLPHYGPVSAAKAALESNIRQLAAELAPHGIAANSIRAGVNFNFKRVLFSAGLRDEGIPVYDLIGGNNGNRRAGYNLSVEPGILYKMKKASVYAYIPIIVSRNIKQTVPDKKETEIGPGYVLRMGGSPNYLVFVGASFKL